MEKKTIELGQHYKEKVVSIGAKGDPMIKIGGYCVFFKPQDMAIEGDMVIVKLTKKLDKVGFGELVEVC